MSKFLILFLFYYPLIMGIVWIIGGIVYYIRRERQQNRIEMDDSKLPFVSILIPAFNEQDIIEETIRYTSNLNYPDYEIIVINDGSTDQTKNKLSELSSSYSRLRVVNIIQNKGKANALEQGVLAAKGEFIATIDCDAILDRDALRFVMPNFITPRNSERVGAVTGNPRIRNRTTLLAKIQLVEYASIIGLIKRTQRVMGKVMTVSGVFAVFRKQALIDIGMWDKDLITDDIGITWKLQRRFWDVRYEPQALCWMLVPETLKGIWNQRLRWTQGGIEVIIRHKNIFLDWRQRRLFTVYIEQLASILWSITWFVFTLIALYEFVILQEFISPFVWIGNYLAFVCLMQLITALWIERKYEKNLLKYFIWAVWYPIAYWHINALLVIFALPKALRILNKKQKEFATWESPDRGIGM